MSDSEDPVELADDGGLDDLFGDGGDDDGLQSDNERALSDGGLASDKDDREPRDDMDGDVDMDQDVVVKDKLVMNINMFRHRTPKPTDGTLRSLKPPSFLKWAAEEYKPDTFEPTEWDQDNVNSDNPKAVVRYQKEPGTGKLVGNALIHKWSDGSYTLSVGGEHYEIQKKMMAPPSNRPYQEVQDAHYYAAAAHLSSNLLITVGHVSEHFTVLPNKNMQDDALAALAIKMQAAAKKARTGDHIFVATKDPELQRKEAEMAEKERMKAQRKRENAVAKLDSGRGGNFRSGGLSIGDLEGGRRGAGGSRKRGQAGASRPKKRRPEYDSDDDLPEGRGRGDDYDHEDDFIAPSDDEGSAPEDDEEEEELLDDDEEDEAPRSKRQKPTEPDEDEDADADADADEDDGAAPAAEQSRGRRRVIMDDDDDDEE